jgi:NAD(P) transhydrogenase subunit alpha
MYAKNIATILLHVVKDGKLRLDAQDDIIRDTLLTDGGEIVNKRLRELYSLPALAGSNSGAAGAGEASKG